MEPGAEIAREQSGMEPGAETARRVSMLLLRLKAVGYTPTNVTAFMQSSFFDSAMGACSMQRYFFWDEI